MFLYDELRKQPYWEEMGIWLNIIKNVYEKKVKSEALSPGKEKKMVEVWFQEIFKFIILIKIEYNDRYNICKKGGTFWSTKANTCIWDAKTSRCKGKRNIVWSIEGSDNIFESVVERWEDGKWIFE